MLRNYLLIAYRNLWHNKVYALINILGLAIGLTAALFIFQYIQFERSYDSFHENADNIYRLIFQATTNELEESPQHYTASGLAPIMKNECPEVVEYARLFQHWTDDFIISYQTEDGTPPVEFMEEKVYYADASFMKMFSFPILIGDAVKSLQEPNTLLLSESMAQKFFGNNWQAVDPIGKIITINGKDDFVVKGVFKDVPENSHIKFEVLLSLPTLTELLHYDTEWHFHFRTYLQVDPKTDTQKLEAKLMHIQEKYLGDMFQRLNVNAVLSLQSVKDIHLHSFGYDNESEIRGSNTTIQFLWITALFILLLAWINYVNLSTARAVKRAKEVGIRKVVGADRRQLIMQFMLEALLINLLSIIVAVTLYQVCYPFFNRLVQKEIPVNFLVEAPQFLTGMVLLFVLGTLLSGGYAAFVLTSFKAISIMKGKFHTSARGILFRKSLIVFQFVISVGLIVGTFTVYRQLMFMRNYELGLDVSQKLVVRAPRIISENHTLHYESFKTDLQKLPDIAQVTASYLAPGNQAIGGQFVLNKKQPEKHQPFPIGGVDYNYLETYKIQVLHGRSFSREFPADKDAAVITEDVALQLGFDPVETALQEKIMVGTNWLNKEVTIIGIVKNINLKSLKFQRSGVVFMLGQDYQEEAPISFLQYNYYTIELNNLSRLQEKLAQIEDIYKKLFPGNPFNYFFLDNYFNAQYKAEEQFGKVFTIASGLAIFIACLGLFGLSAFMVRQRTKEIGIRKVLGASIQNILLLLSKDYIKLVCVAGIIALPLAYFSLHQWLESYMYRIQLSWWLFLVPVVIVIGIALFTVSFQTIKAALTNPAKVLHNE